MHFLGYSGNKSLKRWKKNKCLETPPALFSPQKSVPLRALIPAIDVATWSCSLVAPIWLRVSHCECSAGLGKQSPAGIGSADGRLQPKGN